MGPTAQLADENYNYYIKNKSYTHLGYTMLLTDDQTNNLLTISYKYTTQKNWKLNKSDTVYAHNFEYKNSEMYLI